MILFDKILEFFPVNGELLYQKVRIDGVGQILLRILERLGDWNLEEIY